MEFFQVKSVSETLTLIHHHVFPSRESISMPLLEALNMVLAEDIIAGEDVPVFTRSTVDGYAVRAKETFGASDSLPIFLDLVGRIEMGQESRETCHEGEAYYVPTGGMLPEGCDSVVMIEHAEEIGDLLNVYRQAAPGENVIRAGDDVKKGSLLFEKGVRLRPQELGLLAALGIATVNVYPSPIVGILSTGDEIVPFDQPRLNPGEIRDMNGVSITAMAKNGGARVIYAGIVKDRYEEMKDRVRELFPQVDFLILSGGSSVGSRDYTVKVLSELGEPGILVHGVSVKPGKPTIFGMAEGKPILGLPGHPASAMVIFELFGFPILKRLSGERITERERRIPAKAMKNLASAVGRSDYLRVKLVQKDGELWADPVFGKSGLLFTMVESDGIMEIPAEKEGIYAGEKVWVKGYSS